MMHLWTGRASKTASVSGNQTELKRAGIILNLEGAWLPKSDWSNSILTKARFSRTNLSGANLSGAVLKDAILCGANLALANFDGADLRGADLTGALNLTKAQIDSAIIDETTKLPSDLA